MEIANLTPIFAPTYSPALNPIETIFSWLKQRVKKMRLKDMLQNRHRDFDTLVPLAVRELKKEDINRAIRHVHRLLGI